MALSSTFWSASASPTPMFSVIFVIRGTAIGFVTSSCFMSCRHDLLAVELL